MIELVSNPMKRRVVHYDVIKPLEARNEILPDFSSDPESDEETHQKLRTEILAYVQAMMSPWEEAV